MVACLILYHNTVSGLTKCKMLRAMFHTEEFEIYVSGSNTVTIYLWNVEKIDIWQVAVDFESTNIVACYGFGESMGEAYANAHILLQRRTDGNITSIKEEPAVYEVG